jgi:acyl-CoA thioester hydrolase
LESHLHQWHALPVRVYYEDTDAQGVVYFANYLRFMERGRTEWLRARGIEQDSLMRDENLCFSLIDTNIRFIRPARFNDQLIVRTRVLSTRGARVAFEQAIHKDTADSELLASATCDAASLAVDTFKPRRLPPGLLDKLAGQA